MRWKFIRLTYSSQFLQIKLMRLNQRKKNHALKSLRQGKSAINAKSLQGKEMFDTFLETRPRDETGLPKYRAKSMKGKQSLNPKLGVDHSFMELGKELRSNKTLMEDNSQLKKKMQLLRVSKGGKREPVSRKISAEFEKELYWNGSQSYMISGVKFQYQKMKQNFQKKSDELDSLLKSAQISANQEILHYLEALEVENNLLVSTVQSCTKKIDLDPSEVTQILWMKDRVVAGENKISMLRDKIRACRDENKNLKTKVAFLERLVVEKDNNEHSASHIAKQRQKERDDYQNKCNSLQGRLKQVELQYRQALIELDKKHRLQMNVEQERQSDKLREQHSHISRLQRENTYLHNLVSSWKEEQSQLLQPKKERSSRQKMEKSISLPMDQAGIPPAQPFHPFPRVQIKALVHPQEHQDGQLQRTVPYSADNKNSEQAVKNRRVQPYEMEQIVEWTRFLLIGKGLGIEWLLDQFSPNEEDNWSAEYINMGEVRKIWTQKVGLGESQSLLLSRYLVEYADTEHVYTDDINEHSRTIVKSILKNLLGDYPVYSSQECQQFQKMLLDNKDKLSFTLLNTTKGGLIGKDKFKDLLTSLSLNTNPAFTIYCTAKMTLSSSSLEHLKFDCLLGKSDLHGSNDKSG